MKDTEQPLWINYNSKYLCKLCNVIRLSQNSISDIQNQFKGDSGLCFLVNYTLKYAILSAGSTQITEPNLVEFWPKYTEVTVRQENICKVRSSIRDNFSTAFWKWVWSALLSASWTIPHIQFVSPLIAVALFCLSKALCSHPSLYDFKF